MAGKAIREIYCWELSIDELTILLASTKKGAVRIELSLERRTDCMAFFRDVFPNTCLNKDYETNRRLAEEVESSLLGGQSSAPVSLDISCTSFQWTVMKAVAGIPFGETRTYGEVASMIGRPRGARAVGQALGRIPLPIIFP